MAPVPDDFFCPVGEICQQYVCALEVTDLTCCQMQANRPTLTIAHGMEF
ncbi:hypothetical protein Geu3261_0111_001 [Komagataeibacter europaeus NBRC 3261]|uniref:Uncharacterized protein n=1 Tax=Komagataeibacter europaeus NBRC 3261 TaxID=1234669 RepID=A0A0D6Q0J1_KOMEU|nr:hypothetical protein [Komagataeibacter europaeus]GAN96803.1 hypothetical protein Geu3261_0111_001 [Komagataeibacter europaeus NBRC 3261]